MRALTIKKGSKILSILPLLNECALQLRILKIDLTGCFEEHDFLHNNKFYSKYVATLNFKYLEEFHIAASEIRQWKYFGLQFLQVASMPRLKRLVFERYMNDYIDEETLKAI